MGKNVWEWWEMKGMCCTGEEWVVGCGENYETWKMIYGYTFSLVLSGVEYGEIFFLPYCVV